jgi:hypothetical protein
MLPTLCHSPFHTAPVPTPLHASAPSLSFTNRTPICRLASAPLSTSAKYWRPVSLSSGIHRYRAHLLPIRRLTAPAHLSPVHPSPFPSPINAIPPPSLLSLSTLSTTYPPESYAPPLLPEYSIHSTQYFSPPHAVPVMRSFGYVVAPSPCVLPAPNHSLLPPLIRVLRCLCLLVLLLPWPLSFLPLLNHPYQAPVSSPPILLLSLRP